MVSFNSSIITAQCVLSAEKKKVPLEHTDCAALSLECSAHSTPFPPPLCLPHATLSRSSGAGPYYDMILPQSHANHTGGQDASDTQPPHIAQVKPPCGVVNEAYANGKGEEKKSARHVEELNTKRRAVEGDEEAATAPGSDTACCTMVGQAEPSSGEGNGRKKRKPNFTPQQALRLPRSASPNVPSPQHSPHTAICAVEQKGELHTRGVVEHILYVAQQLALSTPVAAAAATAATTPVDHSHDDSDSEERLLPTTPTHE